MYKERRCEILDDKITLEMARVKARLSQEEIANLLGTNRNTYRDYEKYKTPMRIDTAMKFCDITKTSIDRIIFLNKNYT